MAFAEYIVLAFLASGAGVPAAMPGNAALRTIAADAITQPAGAETMGAAINSNKVVKSHKGGRRAHKGGKKGKKGAGSAGTTPPPK